MNTIQNIQRREVLKTSAKVLGEALALNMLGGGGQYLLIPWQIPHKFLS